MHKENIRSSALIAFLIGSLLSTVMQAADFDSTLVAQKNTYIKSLTRDAQAAYGYRKIFSYGLKITAASLILPPMGALLGNLLIELGTLGYGPHLLTTFIDIRNLENLSGKHPGILTEKEQQILQTGRDVIKGPILRFIEKRLAIKKAINDATQKIMKNLIFFDKKRAQKLINKYLERFIDVAEYEKLKRQRQEVIEKIAQKKSWGIIAKIISQTMNLINKLADHPTLKLSIRRKKKRMTNFENIISPEIQSILQSAAIELFTQVESIKQKKFSSRIEKLMEEYEAMESENK